MIHYLSTFTTRTHENTCEDIKKYLQGYLNSLIFDANY